jgi:hypothetical protein
MNDKRTSTERINAARMTKNQVNSVWKCIFFFIINFSMNQERRVHINRVDSVSRANTSNTVNMNDPPPVWM